MSEKNEVMTMKESTFSYDYVPAKLEINNLDSIKETVAEISKHYENTVYQEDDLNGLNQAHKELNSFRKGLDESRKNVKRKYNKPLNDFEDEIKGLVATIDGPLGNIKKQRDEILDAQEELRRDALNDYIERQLKDTNVRIEDLEIGSGWTNKGNWTDKLNPRKKLTDEIKHQIELVEEEQKKKIADRKVLETFLDNNGMEYEGWVAQLEYREALDIIQDIQRAEEERKQKEQEKERIEQAEQNAEIQLNEQANDEITEPFEQEIERDFEEVEPETVTDIIEVTATREQLNKLNEYMVQNEIQVKAYEPNPFEDFAESLDDLPF